MTEQLWIIVCIDNNKTYRYAIADNASGLHKIVQYLRNSIDPEQQHKFNVLYMATGETTEIPFIDFCNRNNIYRQTFNERMNNA